MVKTFSLHLQDCGIASCLCPVCVDFACSPCASWVSSIYSGLLLTDWLLKIVCCVSLCVWLGPGWHLAQDTLCFMAFSPLGFSSPLILCKINGTEPKWMDNWINEQMILIIWLVNVKWCDTVSVTRAILFCTYMQKWKILTFMAINIISTDFFFFYGIKVRETFTHKYKAILVTSILWCWGALVWKFIFSRASALPFQSRRWQ